MINSGFKYHEVFTDEGEDRPRLVPVTSGKGTDNPSIKYGGLPQDNAGPTPAGSFVIDPEKAQNMSLWDRVLGRDQGKDEMNWYYLVPNSIPIIGADWGAFRVPLEPLPGTDPVEPLFARREQAGVARARRFGSFDKWLFREIRDTRHLIPVEINYRK